MSDSASKIAAALAEKVMTYQDASGEDRFFMEVAKVIGASSQTLEEAFLTEVRLRMAARKAEAFVDERANAIPIKAPDPQG